MTQNSAGRVKGAEKIKKGNHRNNISSKTSRTFFLNALSAKEIHITKVVFRKFARRMVSSIHG